ncbi:MAG: DUF6108 family protein [Paludibacteraceae bacterium]
MKSKKYIIIALMLVAAAIANAQNGLEIQKVFQQYGKSKGAVMVELREKKIGDYEFSLFKSITISNNPTAVNFVRACLEKDQQGAKKVKQVMVSGVLQSMFLQLSKSGKYYRLILFNDLSKTENKAVLIYIESESDSEDILKFILNKK